MRKFEAVKSTVTPLDRANVDTDQIVPKQFLKLVHRTGFGRYLFYNWRFVNGSPNPEFVLNDPRYEGSRILATGENFGCGSSREHAVWALDDYGFRVIVAPSFADIFYSNCFKNGILPVTMDAGMVAAVRDAAGQVSVDLRHQTITAGGDAMHFEIDGYRKRILLEGLDDIALTLQHEDAIARFERGSNVPSAV